MFDDALGFVVLAVLFEPPVTEFVVGAFWDEVAGVNGLDPGVGGLAPDAGGLTPDACGFAPGVGGLAFDVGGFPPGVGGLTPDVGGLVPGVGSLAPGVESLTLGVGVFAAGFGALALGVDGFITAVGGFAADDFWTILEDLGTVASAVGADTLGTAEVACDVTGGGTATGFEANGDATEAANNGVFGLVVTVDLVTLWGGTGVFSGADGLSGGGTSCWAVTALLTSWIGKVAGLFTIADSLFKSMAAGLTIELGAFLLWSMDAAELGGGWATADGAGVLTNKNK